MSEVASEGRVLPEKQDENYAPDKRGRSALLYPGAVRASEDWDRHREYDRFREWTLSEAWYCGLSLLLRLSFRKYEQDYVVLEVPR